MNILLLAIIGAAAGLIATKLMKAEMSLPATLGVGVLGALIGGLLLRALVTALGVAAGLIGAVLGACLLIWLIKRYLPGRF